MKFKRGDVIQFILEDKIHLGTVTFIYDYPINYNNPIGPSPMPTLIDVLDVLVFTSYFGRAVTLIDRVHTANPYTTYNISSGELLNIYRR